VAERPDVASIVCPMLVAWSKLREQIAAFDKTVRDEVKGSPDCRLLMRVPGIGPVTVLATSAPSRTPTVFIDHAWSARIWGSLPGNINQARSTAADTYRSAAMRSRVSAFTRQRRSS
jgi:hypothetical protein